MTGLLPALRPGLDHHFVKPLEPNSLKGLLAEAGTKGG